MSQPWNLGALPRVPPEPTLPLGCKTVSEDSWEFGMSSSSLPPASAGAARPDPLYRRWIETYGGAGEFALVFPPCSRSSTVSGPS